MDIQVVLTENDPKLGKRGQVIKVSSGYAENFLFPHKKAALATAATLKRFEEEKLRADKEEAERLAQAQAMAARFTSLPLRIAVTVGEGDRLFGSVTSQDIQEALSKHGFEIDRKKIHLEEPIKKLGVTKVSVKLYPGVATQLSIEVVKS